jgi:mitogen-activated protein kinase 1/3
VRDFEEVYLVTNLMETSLRNVIVSGQPLEETHFKYFLYQMLRALQLVHSANVRGGFLQ